MTIDYDAEADAAYITLGNRRLGPGEAVYQSDLISTPTGVGNVILDFDADGHLVGVEVLAARELLDRTLLAP